VSGPKYARDNLDLSGQAKGGVRLDFVDMSALYKPAFSTRCLANQGLKSAVDSITPSLVAIIAKDFSFSR
jgi:hypothetical protein